MGAAAKARSRNQTAKVQSFHGILEILKGCLRLSRAGGYRGFSLIASAGLDLWQPFRRDRAFRLTV